MAVVGDSVEFELNQDGTGVIIKVGNRRNYISRKAPRIRGASYRGERLEQIIAANIENLFIVSSVAEPIFNNKTIDRLLVIGESAKLNIFIIINKSDLDLENSIDNWINLYKKVGYDIFNGIDIVGKNSVLFCKANKFSYIVMCKFQNRTAFQRPSEFNCLGSTE